jgi:hypothetical protein
MRNRLALFILFAAVAFVPALHAGSITRNCTKGLDPNADPPLSIVLASISNGEVFSPGSLIDVLTFNLPVNPLSGEISLLGPSSMQIPPSFFSYDATGTILTISWVSLTAPGTYNLKLTDFSCGFPTACGTSVIDPYTVSFQIQGATTTPEPSSLLLFGTCLVVLAPFRRKLFGR